MGEPLFTPVAMRREPPEVSLDDTILLLGSCFTDSIGSRMAEGGLNVLVNPFGVLYNPLSIALCLRHAIERRHLCARDLVQCDGLWHSWLHHSRFSNADRDQCLALCNQSIDRAHEYLQSCSRIIITFGTAHVFYLTTDDQGAAIEPPLLVANCHKVDARRFERRRITVRDIVSEWQPLLQTLQNLPRHPQVLFTVSPIRHLADGLHGNQLSKSTLLLAIDELQHVATEPPCYFPSYEIVLDELRDYRFYQRDMTHPSELAVDIIWQNFQQSHMNADTIENIRRNEREQRRSQHRPIITPTIGG